MRHNEIKTEILIVSKYCFIIKQILNVHKQLSLNKIIFFSYLIKTRDNYYKPIYNTNTSNDVVIKAISQITGRYNDYCSNIKYIIEAIHLLIQHNDILLHNFILINVENSIGIKNYNDKFIDKAIRESNNFSDRQFLKEILNNV